MASTQYLTYTIYLTDKALVEQLQHAKLHGGAVGAIIRAPYNPGPPAGGAAVEFSAPIQQESDPFVAPCIRSSWFGKQFNFPTNVETFTRKSGGWFGLPILFGETTRFYWRGIFAYAGAQDDPTPEIQTAMTRRRWIDGFEWPGLGESGTGAGAPQAARAASRHVDGFGLHLDSETITKSHTPVESGGAASDEQWERLYIRPHRFPTAKARIWKSSGATSALAGMEIGILPSGQLAITNIDNIGTETLLLTVSPALTVHVWKKLDIVFKYGAGYFKVWINGVQAVDLAPGTGYAANGLGQAQNIQTSTIGANAANTLVIDFDDWIGALVPLSTAGVNASMDWNDGSRVVRVAPTAFGVGNDASWAAGGDWRTLRQRPDSNVQVSLTSAVALARLVVKTDAVRRVDAIQGAIGFAAFTIGAYQLRAGAANGTLGWRIGDAGAETLAAIVQAGAAQWNTVWNQPAGVVDPPKLGDLQIIHAKGNDANIETLYAIGASVEVIGLFAVEDAVGLTESQSGSIGGDAGSAALVAAVKADLVQRGTSILGPCGAFEITKRVAWRLRQYGGGLRIKTTGNNCSGYSVDIVMFPDGSIFDCLVNAETENEPAWNQVLPGLSPTLYHEAIDPGDADDGGGEVTDVPTTVRAHTGIHNAPFPDSPWARGGPAPLSGVLIQSGTYVGNGTVIELSFRMPPHWIWIRPTAGVFNGIQWFSSMVAGHQGERESYFPTAPVEVEIDHAFNGGNAEDAQETSYIVRLTGASADYNQAAITYQYVIVSDAGMRFMLNGALDVYQGALDYLTPLINTNMLPEAAFVMGDEVSAAATVRMYYKGIGHAASAISKLDAAETASGLAFSRGNITYKASGIGASIVQLAFSAWRRDDGSGDAGIPKVLQLATYVGDGSASRTINFAPLSGRRPLWAMVTPHNAASIMRDPSHTGTTSTALPNAANAATGITAGGIDSISVGIALNANGIVYDVFVLPGCDTAGNNGWSIQCENEPVEPDKPLDGPWDPEPPDPELNPTPDEPDAVADPDATDFGDQCVDASTQIINQALSRIGISKRVTDIVEQQSAEAATARLHYSDEVSATLRDYPWPFATRYAELVLVAGAEDDPVNGDWIYAWRAPVNSMFNRRIVKPGVRRGPDNTPLEFRVGGDDTGVLIYTNYAQPSIADEDVLTVELEYTIRPPCAASAGDAIFKSALTWRVAHALAPALCRDEKKVAFCWAMYEKVVGTAETKAQNETQQPHDGDVDWIEGRN